MLNTKKTQAQHAQDMIGHLLWAYEQAQLQLRRLYKMLRLKHESSLLNRLERFQ